MRTLQVLQSVFDYRESRAIWRSLKSNNDYDNQFFVGWILEIKCFILFYFFLRNKVHIWINFQVPFQIFLHIALRGFKWLLDYCDRGKNCFKIARLLIAIQLNVPYYSHFYLLLNSLLNLFENWTPLLLNAFLAIAIILFISAVQVPSSKMCDP